MGKKKTGFHFSKKFIIQQILLIICLVISIGILNVLRVMANTTSADAIVNSVGGQFAGTASKLEMDMVVKSSISFSDIITVITTLILLILIILFVSGWIPFIKIVLKKMNIIITRSKE